MSACIPSRLACVGDFAGRWVLAIIVAWIVSFAVFLPAGVVSTILLGLLSWSGAWWQHGALVVGDAITGATGVAVGSMCLQPRSRRVGSAILLFLGLSYYCYFWMRLMAERPEPVPHQFPHLPGFAIGGATAVAWFMVHRPANQAIEPTPR